MNAKSCYLAGPSGAAKTTVLTVMAGEPEEAQKLKPCQALRKAAEAILAGQAPPISTVDEKLVAWTRFGELRVQALIGATLEEEIGRLLSDSEALGIVCVNPFRLDASTAKVAFKDTVLSLQHMLGLPLPPAITAAAEMVFHAGTQLEELAHFDFDLVRMHADGLLVYAPAKRNRPAQFAVERAGTDAGRILSEMDNFAETVVAFTRRDYVNYLRPEVREHKDRLATLSSHADLLQFMPHVSPEAVASIAPGLFFDCARRKGLDLCVGLVHLGVKRQADSIVVRIKSVNWEAAGEIWGAFRRLSDGTRQTRAVRPAPPAAVQTQASGAPLRRVLQAAVQVAGAVLIVLVAGMLLGAAAEAGGLGNRMLLTAMALALPSFVTGVVVRQQARVQA